MEGAGRILVAGLDRFGEQRRAHRPTLTDRTGPRHERCETDTRTPGDGARLGRRLERERLGHQRFVDALSQPHPRGDERRECAGHRSGIVGKPPEPYRFLGVAERIVEVAQRGAGVRAPRVDRAQDGDGDAVLSECLRQDIRGPAFVAQDDEGAAEVQQGFGPLGVDRRAGRDRLEEADGPLVVAGEEQILRGRAAEPEHVGDAIGWREPFSQLKELGRGRSRSAGPRLLGRVFERGRGGVIGAVGGERQMPSALFPVDHHRAQATVDPMTVLARAVRVDRRTIDGMREPDRVTVSRHDPRVDRLREQRFERRTLERGLQELHRGARTRRGVQQHLLRQRREGTHTLSNEIVPEVPRDGKGLARRSLVPTQRRARDLQGEERIPAGRLAQAGEDRPRETRIQPDPHEFRQFAERHRVHGDPRHTLLRQRTSDTERQGRPGVSNGDQPTDPRVLEASEREHQRRRGRTIQPLHVVERDQHRIVDRRLSQHRQRSHVHRSRVGGRSLRFGSQERDLQCGELRRRERPEDVASSTEQVRETGERQRRFRLSGPDRQHAPAALEGSGDTSIPECRLPHP